MNQLSAPRTLLVATSLSFGALTAVAAPSATAEPTPAEVTVARRFYSEAVAFEKAKDWPKAEERLRKVLEIKVTPGVYYHLANSLEQQGKLVEALLNYDRAQELIDAGTKAPDVLRLLGPSVKELKARVPSLTISVAEPVGSMELDGQEVGPSLVGAAFPVDPGSHALLVRTPDGRVFSQTFNATEGEQVEVKPTFPDAPVVVAAPAPAVGAGEDGPDLAANNAAASSQVSQAESNTPWLGLAFVGGAIAGVGAAVYGFAKADSEGDEAHSLAPQCSSPTSPACAESSAAADRRDTASLIGFVGMGAAVGFGALATWQLWPSATEDKTGFNVNFATRF
jgi:hypothetical protein